MKSQIIYIDPLTKIPTSLRVYTTTEPDFAGEPLLVWKACDDGRVIDTFGDREHEDMKEIGLDPTDSKDQELYLRLRLSFPLLGANIAQALRVANKTPNELGEAPPIGDTKGATALVAWFALRAVVFTYETDEEVKRLSRMIREVFSAPNEAPRSEVFQVATLLERMQQVAADKVAVLEEAIAIGAIESKLRRDELQSDVLKFENLRELFYSRVNTAKQ